MKIVGAYLICMLHCFVSVISNEPCFRSKTAMIHRFYADGERLDVTYTKAMYDVTAHLDFESLQNFVPAAKEDSKTVYRTDTYLTVLGIDRKTYFLHVEVYFYTTKDYKYSSWNRWRVIIDRDGRLQITETGSNLKHVGTYYKDCVEDEYLNSFIFTTEM